MSEQTTTTEVVPVTKSEFVEEQERKFTLGDVSKAVLVVSNISGSVQVSVWDQPVVQVKAVKRARSQRSFDRTHIEMSQDGDQITVRTVIDEDAILAGVMDFLRGERAGAKVEYTIKTPAGVAVRAKTVNGSVTLNGLNNQSEANSVNGAVRLEGVAGRVVASTVNGSLDVVGLAGRAELNTVNGSMNISGGRVNQLDARTVSGSIHANISLEPEGAYSFNSTNGDCELSVPADSRCTVSMQAVNGGVECALPHATTASEMRPAFSRWEGTVNGGGAPVHFRTVNGRLRIKSSGGSGAPAAKTSETEATSGASADARAEAGSGTMDILRAVERGELSVDAAMQKLKESKGQTP